jgi:hypothetical protein
MRRSALLAVVAGGALAALAASVAWAHEDREVVPPAGTGSVPQYRTEGPTLLVCQTDADDFARRIAEFEPDLLAANQTLWEQCQAEGFRHLQDPPRGLCRGAKPRRAERRVRRPARTGGRAGAQL